MTMGYYPIQLEMNGRRCLVVGGGAVAERKIASLFEAGADITVVSPEVTAAIAQWAEKHALVLIARKYQQGDLAGFQIVFVATEERDVNDAAYREGRSCGAWVNAADDPAHCDFILPSVLRRGELTVAVSSGATSPALSRTIREELERYFTEEYESLAALAADVRAELQQRSITVAFDSWRHALSGEARRWLTQGETAQAKKCLLRDLGVAR